MKIDRNTILVISISFIIIAIIGINFRLNTGSDGIGVLQGLPIPFTAKTAGHNPNWELLSKAQTKA